jgi:drug/metabolite transporter (DMT)-like permease
MKYLLVFVTVAMTIASALLLDYAADSHQSVNFLVLFILGSAVAVNVVKFVFWGWVLKRYDLSASYPLTSVFFPLIFLTAWWREEHFQAGWPQWMGMALILAGIFVFEKKRTASSGE